MDRGLLQLLERLVGHLKGMMYAHRNVWFLKHEKHNAWCSTLVSNFPHRWSTNSNKRSSQGQATRWHHFLWKIKNFRKTKSKEHFSLELILWKGWRVLDQVRERQPQLSPDNSLLTCLCAGESLKHSLYGINKLSHIIHEIHDSM